MMYSSVVARVGFALVCLVFAVVLVGVTPVARGKARRSTRTQSIPPLRRAPPVLPPPGCDGDLNSGRLFDLHSSIGKSDLSQNGTLFRRLVAEKFADASEIFERFEALINFPELPAIARPLKAYHDSATGLKLVLGLVSTFPQTLFCGCLYSFVSAGWPVNLVGLALNLTQEHPIASLHGRKDLLPFRTDMPPRMHGGSLLLSISRWAIRKMFIFADMSRQMPRDALLVLVDTGDVVAQTPPSVFAAAWAKWEKRGGAEIVHGADRGCYPFTGATKEFGCGEAWQRYFGLSKPPCNYTDEYRGVNGGLLAGRA
eukprot:Hpha_TRINITY_DN22560_c0_g1::TRINITY_DN22560_c0_g1_i1::g.185106::m.185106